MIGNTQLSNNNCPKALKVNYLRQVCNATSKNDISDSESILISKTKLYDIDNDDLIVSLLTINAEKFSKKTKKNKQTSYTNKKKQDNFVDKIFD